jgi:tRNA pseudouridine38-40 synthase
MVRIIVRTLIEVGKGRIAADDIPDIILSKDRARVKELAPAKGLYLLKVEF